MVTDFPAAPDLPPGSLPAFRAMQAAIQALQVDKLSLQSQLSAANAAISRGRQPTTLQQPDLVNANVMIGDAPTLYVDPYAYFTRSGDTQGGLNVSWDYRGPAGELLNGPSEQFEVWVREVRVESDYPAFADMRVDPPPTGDSYMALSTQSMYGVVVRLDILTTYAVKVRSITSLGVPGNFSDETTVTTPKEPRLRPIDPPFVEQCGTDVCLTWDWTQYFDPGTPSYPDVMGFSAESHNTTLTGDERMYHIATASSGNIYVRIQGTGSLRYRVFHPDGSDASFDGSNFLTSTGEHFEVHFAEGPDGNLYSLTMNANPPATGSGVFELANVPGIGGTGVFMEVLWCLNVTTNTLSATSQAPEQTYWTWFSAMRNSRSITQPISYPSGIAWLAQTDFISTTVVEYSLRILDTVSGLSSWSTLAPHADLTHPYGSKLLRLDSSHLAYPLAVSDGRLGSEPPQNPISDSRDYCSSVAIINLSTNAIEVRDIIPPTGWTYRFHIEVIGGVLYAKEELDGGGGGTCRLDFDGTSSYTAVPTAVNGYSDYLSVGVGDWAVGPVAPSRYSGVLYNGLTFLNTVTGYSYRVTATWSTPGSYGPPVTTHNLMSLSGDLASIFDNSPDSSNALVTRADAEMGTLADGRIWICGHLNVGYLSPTLITGDPGTPTFPLNPENPWPEIKYVIAQRLTITGWIDVGTYNGPGTVRDPVPPGTYSYRLVAVSNTGVRGTPTAYMTITVV